MAGPQAHPRAANYLLGASHALWNCSVTPRLRIPPLGYQEYSTGSQLEQRERPGLNATGGIRNPPEAKRGFGGGQVEGDRGHVGELAWTTHPGE